MEKWLLGVLCAPELSAVEKLALVELYPGGEESAVRVVLSGFGDRPVVMRWVARLDNVADVGELKTAGLAGNNS